MPPDFSSLTYWTHRFTSVEPPTGFEWLSPPSSLYALFVSHLNHPASEPRVLHIGSGTSSLSNELRSWVEEKGLEAGRVVNVDYSDVAVEWGRAREVETFGSEQGQEHKERMGWAVVDLLSASSVQGLLSKEEEDNNHDLFTLIIEKSTSDALSCGPLIAPDNTEPLLVLARNLALVSAPGAVWLAMSYSLMRFDESVLGGWWEIEEVVRVPVEDKEDAAVGRPIVEHGIWVLRRTRKVVARDIE